MNGSSESSQVSGIPFANWVTYDQTVERSKARTPDAPHRGDGDLQSVMAELKWTMARESDAADVIQRLAFRAADSTELGERAKEYAIELKRFSVRLESYLPAQWRSGCMTRIAEASMTNRALASLDQTTARNVLISYLIQHAKVTTEVLEGVGQGMNAKAIEMLCRKVTREKQRIAAWIEKHGHLAAQN